MNPLFLSRLLRSGGTLTLLGLSVALETNVEVINRTDVIQEALIERGYTAPVIRFNGTHARSGSRENVGG